MGMNSPGAALFTTIHYVALILLAIGAVTAILVGIRRKRARLHAERRTEAEAEEAGITADEVGEPDEAPPPRPASPPPPARPPSPSLSSTPAPPRGPDPAPAPPVTPLMAPAEPMDVTLPPLPVQVPEMLVPPVPVPAPAAPPAQRVPDAPTSPAATPPTPTPPAPIPVETAPAADGPVTQLKGLGPKVAGRLAELGIETVGDIAALDADGAAAVDARLGPFTGRLHRDRWVEQARFLAAGDRAGFEAVFGRL